MSKKTLESPIFALYIIEDNIIVASGGGDKKFGVKNKLILFNISNGKLSDPIFEKEMGNDIPMYLTGIPEKNIFLACVNNKTIFYLLSNNKFNEILQFQTIDNYSDEIFQSCVAINNNDMCIGTSTGELKHFAIRINNNQVDSINLLSSNLNAHLKSINNLTIAKSGKYKYIITASGDGKCKVFDINTKEKVLKEISKFSFRVKINEVANYFMRDIIYDEKNKYIYTLQSPFKGKTYVTKWSFNNVNNIIPIETMEICNGTGFSFSINENKNVIGITNSEGEIIFIDCYNMKIISKSLLGENIIKCGMFYNAQYFISGSVDNILRCSNVIYPRKNYFSLIFKLIIFGLICLDIYRKKYMS